MKAKFLALIILVGFVVISCKRDSSRKNDNDTKDITLGIEDIERDIQKVYIRFPSPEEMFTFIDSTGLQYDNSLLLPVSVYDKYLDSKSRALNLGTYIADLAYITLFQQYKETMDYFQVVYNMTENLRISPALNESLMNRIEKNVRNIDSLKVLSGIAFDDISDYLIRNDQEKTFVLISIGGFVESLYIAMNIIDEYQVGNETIQRVADQKLVFDNLIKYADAFKGDSDIQQVIGILKPVQDVFDQLHLEENDTRTGRDDKGQLVFSGGNRYIFSDSEFEELNQAVTEARKKITSTN